MVHLLFLESCAFSLIDKMFYVSVCGTSLEIQEEKYTYTWIKSEGKVYIHIYHR